MSTQQLIPELRNLPLALLRKKYDEMTPQERVLAGFVRPATQAEFDAAQTQGAPADFGGAVLPNPDNIQVSEDGEIPVTRLPSGVTFNKQNATGQPQFDVSNPAPAQVIPAAMQTVGAKFDPAQPYEKEAAGSVKFDPSQSYTKETAEEAPKEEKQGFFKSLGSDLLGMVSSGLPVTPTDFAAAAIQKGAKTAAEDFSRKQEGRSLAYRIAAPTAETLTGVNARGMEEAANEGDIAGVYGHAAAPVAATALAEGAGRVLPKVADISATKATAPLRTVAKGANVVLRKAPGTVGASVGGSVGGAVGGHLGAEIGAGAGYALGREILPSIELPENIGLPKRVTGGPEVAPKYEAPANAVPARTQPVKPAQVETMLKKSLGAPEVKPGVPLREQMKPTAQPAPQAGLPNDFTPVKSSALKGYKYSPETQELESITNNGGHYIHGDVTPEQFQAFEQAESKGKAWSDLKQNSTYVGKVVNGKRVAAVPPKELASATPESEPPNAAEARATGKKPPAKVETAPKKPPTPAEAEDLTNILQKSLDEVKAKKGGVMTTADPQMLADRWGTSEKAIADTDAQLRGKNPQQSQDYINKLAESYKKGHPVEPVLETRDAQNNIVSVDGRHRALAAKKAGIQRIPIIVRRLGIAE